MCFVKKKGWWWKTEESNFIFNQTVKLVATHFFSFLPSKCFLKLQPLPCPLFLPVPGFVFFFFISELKFQIFIFLLLFSLLGFILKRDYEGILFLGHIIFCFTSSATKSMKNVFIFFYFLIIKMNYYCSSCFYENYYMRIIFDLVYCLLF